MAYQINLEFISHILPRPSQHLSPAPIVQLSPFPPFSKLDRLVEHEPLLFTFYQLNGERNKQIDRWWKERGCKFLIYALI